MNCTLHISRFVDHFFCRLGRHFWQDECNNASSEWMLVSRCCGMIRVLKPSESDWVIEHREPPKHYVTEHGTITIGEQVTKRLDSPNWWLPLMAKQRWNKCGVSACGHGIQCAASSEFCSFHHQHIEVEHNFDMRTLILCGIRNPEKYLKASRIG